MLDYLPLATLVLALLLFAGMLLSVSAGRRLAARARRSSSSGQLPAIGAVDGALFALLDRKSTRLNSSHSQISYAVFCLKKKKKKKNQHNTHKQEEKHD